MTHPLKAGLAPEATSFLLPLNCAELLPDTQPFLTFFGSVARSTVVTDSTLSKRMFRVLALREKIQESGRDSGISDVLIRRTLCFYRQQKEPLAQVSYQDPDFVKYLRTALPELEKKLEDVILNIEIAKAEESHFQDQIERNQRSVERLERDAIREADSTYKKLSKVARSKVRQ